MIKAEAADGLRPSATCGRPRRAAAVSDAGRSPSTPSAIRSDEIAEMVEWLSLVPGNFGARRLAGTADGDTIGAVAPAQIVMANTHRHAVPLLAAPVPARTMARPARLRHGYFGFRKKHPDRGPVRSNVLQRRARALNLDGRRSRSFAKFEEAVSPRRVSRGGSGRPGDGRVRLCRQRGSRAHQVPGRRRRCARRASRRGSICICRCCGPRRPF